MKKLTIFCVLALLIAFVPAAVFGLADVKNKTVTRRETGADVVFYGTFSYSATDSTSNLYSQAMFIGDCNYYDAYIRAYTLTGITTDDINVQIEFSDDCSTWKAMEVASGKILDQLTGAVLQADTVNVQVGARSKAYHTFQYCRIYFDGQTGNRSTAKVYWALRLRKTDLGLLIVPLANRIKTTTN